ncbi:N-terminal acetyltransferase A, auxiliary subunit [Heracleum sosnowskyi]|uniref:N-terminal acetyltransferase A, auxiliary subunit n=1 Tax=Heracleum sosnowskyi TaxID=360622 RepID=A0AAD8N307_9APIA|nr:N-terminal acetyltransferase A, auxiliary subunit [Heracleum sosnowskyi]
MDFVERERRIKYVADILIQAVTAIVILAFFVLLYKLPQFYISKLRSKNKSNVEARRHFVAGAQLLAKSRSSKDLSAAKLAVEEADRSIALDPKDAASHILKALALDLLGFKTSAIDAINVALSPLAVKSLESEERGDALLLRAELRAGVSGKERVEDSVVEDLVESVKLKSANWKAFVLLGECYEKKEMKDKAVEAYESAVRVEPECKAAVKALERLRN